MVLVCVDILSDAGDIRRVGWNETEDDTNSLALDDDLCWCSRLAQLSGRSWLSWSCSAVDAVQHLGQQGDNWWTSSEYRLKEPWSILLKGCGWFLTKLVDLDTPRNYLVSVLTYPPGCPWVNIYLSSRLPVRLTEIWTQGRQMKPLQSSMPSTAGYLRRLNI